MENIIEHELNVAPKNHWIFSFKNTLEEFIICRLQNAEPVRCALPVDGFLGFPILALYINLSLHSLHRWIFIFVVLRNQDAVLIDTRVYFFHDLFMYCVVFPISLCFLFLRLLLFSIRENYLSRLMFRRHSILIRKEHCKHLLKKFWKAWKSSISTPLSQAI